MERFIIFMEYMIGRNNKVFFMRGGIMERVNTRFFCRVCGDIIPINAKRRIFCCRKCEISEHKNIMDSRIPEDKIPDYISKMFKEISINPESVLYNKRKV
jgi:ribosomal protein L37AE/L43A